MLIKIIIYSSVFLFSQGILKAQGQLDWLMKQSDFKPILADHLREMARNHEVGLSTVSALLFRPHDDTLTVYLTSYGLLNEAKKHLPTSFTTIEKQPFLTYDGSEILIEDKNSWFEAVKTFIAGRLCNDIEPRELASQLGPKVIKIPCGFIYDAPIEKLTFSGGRLIKRKLVSRVPYYMEQKD